VVELHANRTEPTRRVTHAEEQLKTADRGVITSIFFGSDHESDQPSRSIPHETDAPTSSEGQHSGYSLCRFPNLGLQHAAWRRLRRRRSLSPSNQPIQLPDHLALTPAAFFTSRQMIQTSRQVQPIAQLNAQVIEVLATGKIESGLREMPLSGIGGWVECFHVEEPMVGNIT